MLKYYFEKNYIFSFIGHSSNQKQMYKRKDGASEK